MKNKVKGSISQTTITLKYEGVTIYIKRETDMLLFEEAKAVLKKGNDKEIVEMFLDIKAKLEKFTNMVFEVEKEQIFLKGDTTPIPDLLAEKLLHMERAKEDFMPLVRFWKKLRTNPSQDSIDQLYGFLVHNNIPITETGDIVTEKGVTQKRGGMPEELVDCHTKQIDNSIGMEVSMDRSEVDADPTQTCSNGLHVGAPDYVRRHYGNDIIVKCLVNPRDVVAVPKDYNNTKMRVCRYVVAGYSTKMDQQKLVFSLNDFMQIPTPDDMETMERLSTHKPSKGVDSPNEVKSKKAKKKDKHTASKKFVNKATKKIDGLSASKIVELVNEETGVMFTFNLKSKKTIVKNAIKVLSNHYEAKA